MEKRNIILLVIVTISLIITSPVFSDNPIYEWVLNETATTSTMGIYYNDLGQSLMEIDGNKVRYKDNEQKWAIVNKTIILSNSLWDYEIVTGLYNSFFKSDPSSAQTIKYVKDDSQVFLQPMSLNYRNDLNQIQQINVVQSVQGFPSTNKFIYNNIFGDGLNLEYEYQFTQLKEKLIINSLNSLPEPAQYIIDGGNPTLDFDLIIDYDSDIDLYIGGILWDKKTSIETSERIDFKKDNIVIFHLPKPHAYDLNNERNDLLKYQLKKSGTKLYIIIKTPYSWLQNLNYPVVIDPPLTLDGISTVLRGYIHYDYVSITNYGALYINATDGIDLGRGQLNLSATEYITVDETSTIAGVYLGSFRNYSGWRGGGPPDLYYGKGFGEGFGGGNATMGELYGGDGAGHGGKGGAGGYSLYVGGKTYGNRTNKSTFMGSGGGAGGGESGPSLEQSGGKGGASIFLNSTKITILGNITVRGSAGGSSISNAGAGGGSGGTIMLQATNMILNGSLSAHGGRGGNANTGEGNGGGGGGGRIKIFYKATLYNTSLTINISGGAGGSTGVGGADGADGTIYYLDENDPPNITSSPTITPSSPKTNQDLNCTFVIEDINSGDSLKANFSWYNDDVLDFSGQVSVTNGTSKSLYLNYQNTSHNEVWNCTIKPYDGYEYGTTKSDEKTVLAPDVTLTPISYLQVFQPNQTKSFNISLTHDSTTSINYTYSYSIDNSSWWNITFQNNSLIIPYNTETDNLITIKSYNTSHPNGIYNGYVNLTRVFDSNVTQLILNLSVSASSGQPHIVNKVDWNVSMYSDETESKNWTVNNTGDYALSKCYPNLTGDFIGEIWWNISLSNFSLSIGQLKNLTLTFENPTSRAFDYDGYLEIECVATVQGYSSALAPANRPDITLSSTTRPTLPSPEGGGGVTPPLREVGNKSWRVRTDADIDRYNLQFPKLQKTRRKAIFIDNTGTETLNFNISCFDEDEVKKICSWASFSTTNITVSPKSTKKFWVSIERQESVNYGDKFYFAVNTINEETSIKDTIGFNLNIHIGGEFWSLVEKLGDTKTLPTGGISEKARDVPLPIILIFFFSWIILGFLIYFGLKAVKLKIGAIAIALPLSFIIALIITIVI